MPFSRLPGKQGVEILDQPVEVDGPVTNGDPAPADYKPVIVGGEALDFGHGVSAQDIVSLWMTRGGAPVIGAQTNGDAGSDGVNVAFASPTGANALLQLPFAVAQYVYDANSNTWARKRGDALGDMVQGVAAFDTPIAANPVTVGGRATGSIAGASSVSNDGDVQNVMLGVYGNVAVASVADTGADAESNEIGMVATLGGDRRLLGVAPYVMNGGGSWDRLRGNLSGVFVQGSVASGATAAGNPVPVGGEYIAVLPTFTNGQRATLVMDSRGGTYSVIKGANSSNTAIVGSPADSASAQLSLFVISQNSLFNGSTWDRMAKASSTSRIPSSAASTNATSAKASAGTVYSMVARNNTANVIYLKLYNKASAPTVGTDTPVLTLPISPNTTAGILDHQLSNGWYFNTGIAYALTTGAADADTGAVGAGDVTGLNISYS